MLHACVEYGRKWYTLYTFTPTQHKTEVLLRVLRPPYGGMAPFHAQVVYGRSWFHSMTRTMHTKPGGGWYVCAWLRSMPGGTRVCTCTCVHDAIPYRIVYACHFSIQHSTYMYMNMDI